MAASPRYSMSTIAAYYRQRKTLLQCSVEIREYVYLSSWSWSTAFFWTSDSPALQYLQEQWLGHIKLCMSAFMTQINVCQQRVSDLACCTIPHDVQVYTDVKQLRYGHLMIMTDQDHDGSHIKGLIMNYFHTFYPSLMLLPGFLIEFITPVIKVGLEICVWHSHRSLQPFQS